jgi:hypothetical protein
MYLVHCEHSPFLLVCLGQIQGYGLWFMPAMDFCNTMEFPLATLWIFVLQLSVFLSYNKQRAGRQQARLLI